MLTLISAVIQIAGIEVDAFQKDGEYFLSQSQVAKVIGVNSSLVLRFLRSNCSKDNADKDFRFCKIATDFASNDKGGARFIVAIPPKLASLFWGYQARKGNNKALALVCACAEEALERRCDRAFKEVKTEEVYDKRLASNFEQMYVLKLSNNLSNNLLDN